MMSWMWQGQRACRNTVTGGVAMAALLCALGSIGCEQPRWDDPAYVGQQLESEDANARRVALERMGELPEDKKKALAPALTKVYLMEDVNQKDVMTTLASMRDPAAKDAYLKELQTDATGYAAASAEALGEMQAKEAIPGMIDLMQKTDDPDIKQGILRGLSYMPDAQMVPALTKLLELDPDNHPIALHAYACEILGEIAQTSPQAIDEATRTQMVRGLFLANKTSQNVSSECGLAIQQLGAPALPLLVSAYKGEFDPAQKLMMAYNFPSNRPKGVATARLVSLRAAEQAGPLFIEDLKSDHEVPQMVASNRAAKTGWLQMDAQTLSEQILGAGDLRLKEAVEPLIDIMEGKRNKDWSAFMLDPAIQTQIRQDAARALNAIGDREAIKPMMRMIEDLDANTELEKMAAYFEGQGKPMDPIERYSFNYTVAQAVANLGTGEHAEDFDKVVSGIEDEKLRAKLEELKAAFGVYGECAAKGDSKAQAECYGAKLKGGNMVERKKAVYELTRLAPQEAAPILAANLGTDSMEVRELVTSALYTAPSKGALTEVERLIKEESDRNTPEHRLDQRRLALLQAWLKNNVT